MYALRDASPAAVRLILFPTSDGKHRKLTNGLTRTSAPGGCVRGPRDVRFLAHRLSAACPPFAV